MITWSTLGPLLALDNALVALALAPYCRAAGRLWLLAAAFVVVEAVAPLAGLLLGAALPLAAAAETVTAVLLVTLALGVGGLALAGRDPARLAGSGAMIAGLALLLGIDNLLAGAGLQSAGAGLGAGLAAGIASAAVVLLACAAGAAAGRHLPEGARAAACAGLLLAAGAAGLA